MSRRVSPSSTGSGGSNSTQEAIAALKPHLDAVFVVEGFRADVNARVGIRVKKSLKWNVFVITAIRDDSIFAETRMEVGNIIVTINGKPCPDTLPDVLHALGSISGTLKMIVAKTKPSLNVLLEDEYYDDEGNNIIDESNGHIQAKKSFGNSTTSSSNASMVDFTGKVRDMTTNTAVGSDSFHDLDDEDIGDIEQPSSSSSFVPTRHSTTVITTTTTTTTTKGNSRRATMPAVPGGSSIRVVQSTKRQKSDKLGLTVALADSRHPSGRNSILITRVQKDGMFPSVQPNSVLRSINGKPCKDYDSTIKMLKSAKSLKLEVEEPSNGSFSPTSSGGANGSDGSKGGKGVRPSLADGPKYKSIMVGKKEIKIESPPKGVVVIWILIAAELVFDLVTTAIAFNVFLSDKRSCCGQTIEPGNLPLATSIPFALLIVAELLFLLRAMRLTLWPPTMSVEELDPNRSWCSKVFFGKQPRFIMWLINILTIINPFFGFVIAWMLIYQSDEQEAYLVFGLECATIILHFIAVYYEGQAKSCCSKLFHAITIIPFLATGVLLAWFLQVGGICYNSDLDLFWFDGCEVCPNGLPPVDGGLCATTEVVNGVNSTVYKEYFLWELEQTDFCDSDAGLRMCFFPVAE